MLNCFPSCSHHQVYNGDFLLSDISKFSISLLHSPLFEKDVLPGLLAYLCRRYDQSSCAYDKSAMLSLLGDIVLRKVQVPSDGSQTDALGIYTLDFGRATKG